MSEEIKFFTDDGVDDLIPENSCWEHVIANFSGADMDNTIMHLTHEKGLTEFRNGIPFITWIGRIKWQ